MGVVGHVPQGFPSPILPDLGLAEALWPGALGIALMSFTETMAAGRAFARSDEPPLAGNRELLATGLANAGGALLGSMPAGGGTSQTAVNRLAGARTQLAGLVTAVGTLLTMLFLAPLIGLMPQATLAAIVVVYSVGLIKPAEFGAILGVRRMEFLWALAALSGVVLLGTLKGILVAIVVSLFGLAQQVANPPVRVLGRKPGTNVFRPRSNEHPEDETFTGLLLLRFEGRIFFVNAERIAQKVRDFAADVKPRVIALDLCGVFDLEYTALKMLSEAEGGPASRVSRSGSSVSTRRSSRRSSAPRSGRGSVANGCTSTSKLRSGSSRLDATGRCRLEAAHPQDDIASATGGVRLGSHSCRPRWAAETLPQNSWSGKWRRLPHAASS